MPSFREKIAAHYSTFSRTLRQRLFTRENVWALIVAGMLLFLLLMSAAGSQPRFVYGGF